MNNINEEIKEMEILKINHDEAINKLLNKYSLEDGYDIEIIAVKPLDVKNEVIIYKVKTLEIENKKVVK